MKQTIILLSFCIFLTACSVQSFYQVYKTNPTNGKIESDKIIFEDTTIQITYNLWGNGGDAGFQVFNKSNHDITIHLDHSFFVLNGIAHDYYRYRTITKASNRTTSYRTFNGNYSTIDEGATTNYSEPRVIIIPSMTAKRVYEYNVTNVFLYSCDLLKYPSKKKIKTQTFDQNNSPFVFSNLITYSIQGDTNRLENKFFVTSISNLPESEVFETKFEVICDKQTDRLVKVAKNSSPEKFYVEYFKR